MSEENNKFKDIDDILNRISINDNSVSNKLSLRERFDNRVTELGITPTYVLGILKINYRALEGILDGTQKRIDFVTLTKLAQFLGVTNNEIVELYVECLESNNNDDIDTTNKRTFITNNFDLPVLKSMGVINSITDFQHIEDRLKAMFEINSITDYNIEKVEAAFSSGAIKPKNVSTRNYFINKSKLIFNKINNPFNYDKQALIEYFPKIRWHSTDIENGLINVFKSLYKLGVTVIFQPFTPSIHLRGATFSVSEKPCIVLTNYRGFYPTLWFALIHELFHVLFDWDEILNNEYHLSDEENDLFVLKQKEDEANDFAREFLFPKSKMDLLVDKIDSKLFVKEFALDNHVHPSIVYAKYVYDNSTATNNLWGKFQKQMVLPDSLLNSLGNGLGHKAKSSDFSNYFKNKIFNSN